MNLTRFTPKRIFSGIKIRYWRKTRNLKAIAGYNYFSRFGEHIDWLNPKDLNQWINWLEFNSDISSWSVLADKYRVRDFIADKGFKGNLVPLVGVWDNPNNISFNELPSEFVLKINNGSGDVRIIRDKNEVDLNEIKHYFNSLFKHPYGVNGGEPHYFGIKPMVIAEVLLDINKQPIKSSSIVDYKFWCFNGSPHCCFVCSNRTKQHFNIDLYSASDWKRIEKGNMIYSEQHLRNDNSIPQPDNLSEMLKIASSLSKGFPQMRVDLYEIDGKVYIGELTMTSFAGVMDYFSKECLIEMGNLCKQAVKELGILDSV